MKKLEGNNIIITQHKLRLEIVFNQRIRKLVIFQQQLVATPKIVVIKKSHKN